MIIIGIRISQSELNWGGGGKSINKRFFRSSKKNLSAITA